MKNATGNPGGWRIVNQDSGEVFSEFPRGELSRATARLAAIADSLANDGAEVFRVGGMRVEITLPLSRKTNAYIVESF